MNRYQDVHIPVIHPFSPLDLKLAKAQTSRGRVIIMVMVSVMTVLVMVNGDAEGIGSDVAEQALRTRWWW